MKTYQCSCGSELFFENSTCLACGADVGWCPGCESITSLVSLGGGAYRCGNAACGIRLSKCHNYEAENVCNRCIAVAEDFSGHSGMCDCCIHNDTIPDLSVVGNREKWIELEAAKRRLFYTLNLLGLPVGVLGKNSFLPLLFDFKADVIPGNEFWRNFNEAEKVYTGHANGRITINIREADSVEREALRVDLGEAHRTLVGHFRHEIGHYYWELLVRGQCEPDCVAVFGDHQSPTYAEALDRHYQQGAPVGWEENYISSYATMHPWEDFAETFAAWLDLASVLDSADNTGFQKVPDLHTASTESLVNSYRKIGIAMNEMNRTMGLLDFLPVVLKPPVVDKLRFVHQLIRNATEKKPAVPLN